MKPIPFPEQTTDRETISLWQLSWWERVRLLFTGRLWLRQVNFSQPLQAQKLQVEYPFRQAEKGGA